MIHRILLDGEGGEGNGFLATLPAELRTEPSLATFKDPGALAKSYVEAQKLIGANRIALPGEKATDEDWGKFFDKIGRPETPDKYEDVVLKDKDGKVILEPDKEQAAELKKFFHKMGLTGKQAKMMQQYSLEYLAKNQQGELSAKERAEQDAIAALKQEWGDKFDVNVDVARSVIKKFGGEEAADIQKFLNESGIGNNPRLVKLFAKIGDSILEDRGQRGTDTSLPTNDRTRASQEIDLLKSDAQFQKALGDANAPGHQEAVNRWINLHSVAHPGKSE